MTTDVEIEKLKINVLKKRQYDSIDPSDEELYLISDAYENIVYLETVADTAPETIVDGVMYYNTTDGKLYEYDLANEQWDDIGDPTVEVLYIDKEHRTAYVYTDNHQFIQISSSGGAGNVDDETTTLNEQDQISVIGVKEKRAGAIKYDWIGTKQQYDNLQSYNDNWIYYITDDAETTDNNMSMNNVYNRLNRAYAWTYRTVNGNGSLYLIGSNGNYIISDAISAQEAVDPSNDNFCARIYSWDGKLYNKSISGSTISYTQIGNNIGWTCIGQYFSNSNLALGICNNDLYNIVENNVSLRDSGGWQFVTGRPHGDLKGLGIKNDSLYVIFENSITLLDASGVWSKISGCVNQNNCVALGVKDNKLYKITETGTSLISNEEGWKISCPTPLSTGSNNYGYAIHNKKLYVYKNNSLTLVDDTILWKKIGLITQNYSTIFAISEDGKLYKYDNTRLTQIGTDTTWTDISDNFGINNGDIYVDLDNPVKLTEVGGITKCGGVISNSNYSLWKGGNGWFWTGDITETEHTVYTVPTPNVGYKAYTSNTLSGNYSTITGINTNNLTISDGTYTYTRDSSRDKVFSFIPDDTKNQLLSVYDVISAIKG